MKKIISLLLVLTMVVSIAACGSSDQSGSSDTSNEASDQQSTPASSASSEDEETEYQFALGTSLTDETNFTADDGTVLMTQKYEFPQLEVQTADGTPCDLSSVDSEMADICQTFNDAMQTEASNFEASVQETLASAQSAYANLDSDMQAAWANYSDELTIGTTYQTSGILSIQANCYSFYGGAHPSTYTRTWNYDLTTGEFITFDTLLGDTNPFADTLDYELGYAIQTQIDEQGLSEGYFDDYIDYINDLPTHANFCLQDSGMLVIFDTYVLAPYAAGAQTFTIPYSTFYYALPDHIQSLIDISEEDSIIADYRTTELLWSWFNMTTPELASDGGQITTSDGSTYYHTSVGNITTLDGLRELLCLHISEDLADQWINSGRFIEEDSALYVSVGVRGGNINFGDEAYSVELDGESGEVIQTLYLQDYNSSTGTYELNGESDEYSYPFNLVNGHAIFTEFNCPY